MDPLPLYIVLLAGLPLVLPMLVRKAWAVVAVSLTVYLLAPWFGWNLAAIKDGVWYFNPVAWQLLFVLGGAAAIHCAAPTLARDPTLMRQPLFVGGSGCMSWSPAVMTVVVALAADPRRADAGQPEQLAVPDQQDRPVAGAPAALPGPGLRHRETAARHAAGRKTGWPGKAAAWGVFRWKCSASACCWRRWRTWSMRMTDDAFAMQIFTALVGAGLMALLAAWLEFNKRLNRLEPAACQQAACKVIAKKPRSIDRGFCVSGVTTYEAERTAPCDTLVGCSLNT